MSTKIYRKVHVFWECALGGVLEGFWQGFGKLQTLIFQFFFYFFSKQILKRVSKSKQIDQNGDLNRESANLGRGAGGPEAPGERL